MAQLKTKIALRSDTTANWQAVADTATLVKGEVGIEFLTDGTPKMKIGDGVSTWGQLPYVGGSETTVLEVVPQEGETHTDAIDRVATGKSLSTGDVAYVKQAIYIDAEDETKNKYSYTGYVYNGTAWAAMDGNYSADNVYFDDDMLVTKEIGYITLTNGSGTIPSAGKNLTQVFEAMFVKESQPTVTDPSISVEKWNGGEYEVGTEVTPTYEFSFSPGSYTYGPDTGVIVVSADEIINGWKVSATGVEEFKSTSSGSFDSITVNDETNYKVTAIANHTAGTKPLTNKGNESTKDPISAGTKSITTTAISGYRKMFMGSTSVANPTIDSAFIRSLSKSEKAARAKREITAAAGDTMIVWAFPTSLTTKTPTFNYDFMSTWYTLDGVEKYSTTLDVEGANGFDTVPYTVYTYSPSSGAFEASTKTQIIIS